MLSLCGYGNTAEKQTRQSDRLCKQTYYWFSDDLKHGGCDPWQVYVCMNRLGKFSGYGYNMQQHCVAEPARPGLVFVCVHAWLSLGDLMHSTSIICFSVVTSGKRLNKCNEISSSSNIFLNENWSSIPSTSRLNISGASAFGSLFLITLAPINSHHREQRRICQICSAISSCVGECVSLEQDTGVSVTPSTAKRQGLCGMHAFPLIPSIRDVGEGVPELRAELRQREQENEELYPPLRVVKKREWGGGNKNSKLERRGETY
jgi:hypothetical protein